MSRTLSPSCCREQTLAQSQAWTQFDSEVTSDAVGTAQAMGAFEQLQPGLLQLRGGLWDTGTG